MSYFDEVDYLLRNPDVRPVVCPERFPCGEHHYNEHGRAEGRVARRVPVPPRAAYLLRRLASLATIVRPPRDHWSGIHVRWWRSGGSAGHLSVRVLHVSRNGIRTVRRKTIPLAGIDERHPLYVYWAPIERSAGQRFFVLIRRSGAPRLASGSTPFLIAEDDGIGGGLVYSDPEPVSPFPWAIAISPVTQCNLNCIHCISRHSRQAGVKVMDDAVWDQIVAGVRTGHVEHVRGDYSGDLLYSDRKYGGWLDRMISLDLPFHIDTHANDLTAEVAEKLVRSRLRTINFSIDSLDPEDYPRIRRGARPLAEVLANIRHFMTLVYAHGADIQTNLSFVLMRRNLESIDAALDFAKEVGIGYVCGSHMHAYTADMVEESLLLVPHWYAATCERLRARARAMGVLLTLPEPIFLNGTGRGHKPCSIPRTGPQVLGNGDVMVCCMPGTKIGNLSQDSLTGIWNGAAMRAFRARVNSDDPPEPCTVCAMQRELTNLAALVPGLDEAGRRAFEARCLEAVRTGA